ncbi:MAG TPA: hypothetical protein VLM18_01135 [Croceibacterium sp.]|nr:hypothetical protein [Croceibacterium sp.]
MPPGYDQDGGVRVALVHDPGELKSVHRTEQFDIREQRRDRCSFEQLDRCLTRGSLDNFESSLFEHVSCHHAQQSFIFGDED